MTIAMKAHLRPALVLLVLFSALTGAVYPLAVTAAARALFPAEAAGSLVRRGDTVSGSLLIGQPGTEPGRFWGRPSATGNKPYDAMASGGSNLGPTNPALRQAVAARIASLRAAHPDQAGPPPLDLVTASASGLDPHISPAAARYQAGRVARARGLSQALVEGLIQRATEGRALGLFGEPRVNVLRLNLLLDGAAAITADQARGP